MPSPEFPTLETPRLHLREITDSDAPALFAIHSNAGHMQWFGSDPLTDLNGALELVKLFAGWRQQANPGTRWGIELKDRPGLVGTCGLFGWNRGWSKCTLGYELSPEATGQGLMREALEAVIPWGLAAMKLNRIEALVHERNAASLGLLARLGFVQEGRLRQVAFWNGQHHDMLQLSLLAAEWPGPSPVAMLD
jgi:ribosomal-protein-alanine N-acetyltransferase